LSMGKMGGEKMDENTEYEKKERRGRSMIFRKGMNATGKGDRSIPRRKKEIGGFVAKVRKGG